MIGKKKAVVEEMLCGKWIPPIMKSPIPDLDVCKENWVVVFKDYFPMIINLLRRCFCILTPIYLLLFFLKKRRKSVP
jgi:hypothetical protein